MTRRLASILALSSALAACASRGAANGAPLVAKGDDIAISADDFKARIDQQVPPMARGAFASADRKKAFLDDMIQTEVVARAAEKEGLANDPEVRLVMKRVLAAKYQRVAQSRLASKVTDDEIKAYYDANPGEFHAPARVHAAQIFLAADGSGAAREEKRAEAKKVLAKVLGEEPRNPAAFGITAREVTEDAAAKLSGGDLMYKSLEELEQTFGKDAAQLVFALKDGETSPQVVEAADGFHLFHVYGRQPVTDRSLEDAKAEITRTLAVEHKSRDWDDLVKKLRDDAHVAIDAELLEKTAITAPVASTARAVPPALAAPAQAPASPAAR